MLAWSSLTCLGRLDRGLSEYPTEGTKESLILELQLLMIHPPAGAARARRRPADVLGTAGWEITDGRTVVLVDPYLSRLRRVTPNDTVDPADARPLFDNAAIAQSDTATIDARIQRADFVLITHTHYDHALDAPYIAGKTGATIIGTENTYHLRGTGGSG